MSIYLGLDLGTSSVKAVLVDGEDRLLASASVPLTVSRPRPGWSEQNPEDWWQATLDVIDRLAAVCPAALAATAGIGFSGQMHGAVLLDRNSRVLRPAILWNDGRSSEECRQLEERFPELWTVTGNRAMAGFTAPKLLWVQHHEPALFASVAHVLLPKAYIRYRLTDALVEDMSDASGTLWLDVGARVWSDAALAAVGLTRDNMPRLVEGTEPAGQLRTDLARRWGMRQAPVVAGGAGDNAASAIGLGAVAPGSAFISLGTSGVLWATTDRFAPNPAAAVHAFCHAVPNTWHQMGVILSAASSFQWLATILRASEAELLVDLGDEPKRPAHCLFLPYLSGERTPHNNPNIRASLTNLAYETDRGDLVQGVLEGVAFAFRDCMEALRAAGTVLKSADVVGGAARSHFWIAVLANVLEIPLNRIQEAEAGAAIGAARLGRLAATGETVETVCRRPRIVEVVEPRPTLQDAYAVRYRDYRHTAETWLSDQQSH